jgi:aminodeoxyfutalosine deaminase
MGLEAFIREMPKVELHVHLEGSVRPATLLALARRHNIELPANTVEGIQQWYAFKDFAHFVQIYLKISSCIRTTDDIELIAREFLVAQAHQNIRYSEVTYTAWTHYVQKQMKFEDQLAALNRAKEWGEGELGVSMKYIIDIPRVMPADTALTVADWAISGMGRGVVALGLGGPEAGNPVERYAEAYERAHSAGLPCILHAGEHVGPESIWGAIRVGETVRIGHGVRCLEDPTLVRYLRQTQIPLEVCPTSNICLGVFPRMEDHPLPRLMSEGLYVTLNSDDPPMFNTTLTDEYLKSAQVFALKPETVQGLVMNALRAARLADEQKVAMEAEFTVEFQRLYTDLQKDDGT